MDLVCARVDLHRARGIAVAVVNDRLPVPRIKPSMKTQFGQDGRQFAFNETHIP